MTRWWLSLVWCACGAPAASPPGVTFRSTPQGEYQVRQLQGWQVNVASGVPGNAPGDAALALLDAQLAAVAQVVPAAALARLREVPLWLSAHDTVCPAACYHPSAEWLSEHGYEPAKHGGVEITDVQRFVDWSQQQPWMVLHELAHSYHHQVLGFNDADLAAKGAVPAGFVLTLALREVKDEWLAPFANVR